VIWRDERESKREKYRRKGKENIDREEKAGTDSRGR
jgi:hypothetical protein